MGKMPAPGPQLPRKRSWGPDAAFADVSPSAEAVFGDWGVAHGPTTGA